MHLSAMAVWLALADVSERFDMSGSWLVLVTVSYVSSVARLLHRYGLRVSPFNNRSQVTIVFSRISFHHSRLSLLLSVVSTSSVITGVDFTRYGLPILRTHCFWY